MPAITITDLNHAKTDVDHIAAVATSTAPTATDRLGGVKKTMAGITTEMNAQVALVTAAKNTAVNVTIPAAVAEVDEAVAATYVGQANAAKDETEELLASAELVLAATQSARDMSMTAADIYPDDASGLAATASGGFYKKFSADDTEIAILMKDNAGVAEDTGRRVPSVKGVRNQAKAATRSDDKDAALNGTADWTALYFRPSTAGVTTSGTRGEYWSSFDAGTDVAVDEALNAAVISLSVDATAAKIQVRLWEVNTTDANVNVAPPQTNDVLVSDVTFTSLSTLEAFDGGAPGITLNSTEREFVFPFAAPIIAQTGKTYKMTVRALNASDTPVTLQLGFRTVSGETRQRRAGAFRATPAGSFTNIGLTSSLAMGILQRDFNSTAAMQSDITALETANAGMSQSRLRAQNNGNHDRLAAHAGAFAKTLPDASTYSGDSLIFGYGASSEALYAAPVVAGKYYAGTVNNIGVSSTRSDAIRATFLALAAGQQNDYGITNGGTNDILNGTSGVTSVEITAAGSGGTNGTFALAFSGGTSTAPLTVPTGTFTVSGGAVTAVNITSIGGGYTVAPTISTAASAGLTGATLTGVLSVPLSVISNMTDIANASANRLLMGPWLGTGQTAAKRTWARARRICAGLKTAFGGRFFDALPFLFRFHSGAPTELATVRSGLPPTSITADALHPNDAGYNILGREFALMVRASAAVGAPYIHDETVAVADTAATTVWTPRKIGTPTRYAIVEGNDNLAFEINASTGVITRAATGTMPYVSELFVQAESNLGLSNVARVVVYKKMAGTAPTHGVRMRAGAGLAAEALTGATATKKVTIAFCARINNRTAGTLLTTQAVSNESFELGLSGRAFRIVATNTAGGLTLLGGFGPLAQDLTGYNMYFLSVDTTGGVQTYKSTVNEETASTSTPTLDATFNLSSFIGLFTGLTNLDIKMFWLAQDYIDVSNPAKRALFYTPSTREPLDLGATGVVDGITPLIYFTGNAGDYVSGNNRGSGGTGFYSVPYINAANMGCVDLDA